LHTHTHVNLTVRTATVGILVYAVIIAPKYLKEMRTVTPVCMRKGM